MAVEDRLEFWKARIDSFIPGCTYQDEETTEAVKYGLAAVLNRIDCSLAEHFLQTFICRATGSFLNEHGLERNIERGTNEVDLSLAQRTKNIANTSSCPDLKLLVDALLEVGESTFFEDEAGGVFFNREHFYNRGDILIEPIINTCLLYTSPSPRDQRGSRMPSSA